jgi:glycosyltransferase involved in cell wall biosynthesis
MLYSKKIHLGILYIGKQGGVCHYTYELVRAISKIARVTCYFSSNNVLLSNYSELSCQVKTFDTYDGFPGLVWSMINQEQPLNIAKEIQQDGLDILLDTGSSTWEGIVKKALDSKILVVDVLHDVEIHPDRWLPLIKIYRFFYPNNADAFIGISDYSFRQIPHKFPDTPTIKSLHGIIHSSSIIDSDNISRNRNKFLFLGRIEKYKGLELLVKSFQIAKQSCPNISMSIVGKGLIDEQLKKHILELDIQLINRWVSESELSEIVASHGVIVMPYLSATQSGVAAVALGNGLPAIATDVGALPEQIIHGRNGLIVPQNDANGLAEAMLTVSQDYTVAYQMSKEACLIADMMYSWDKIANDLLEDFVILKNKIDDVHNIPAIVQSSKEP